MKKIVVDTNVFISALLGSKSCRQIYEFLKEDKFQLVISENLLTELRNTLTLAKFEFTKEEIDELIEHIFQKAQKVELTVKVDICRDSKDNIIIECAIAGNADFIVTGDNDLLTLKKFKGVFIVSPKEFLKHFSS